MKKEKNKVKRVKFRGNKTFFLFDELWNVATTCFVKLVWEKCCINETIEFLQKTKCEAMQTYVNIDTDMWGGGEGGIVVKYVLKLQWILFGFKFTLRKTTEEEEEAVKHHRRNLNSTDKRTYRFVKQLNQILKCLLIFSIWFIDFQSSSYFPQISLKKTTNEKNSPFGFITPYLFSEVR